MFDFLLGNFEDFVSDDIICVCKSDRKELNEQSDSPSKAIYVLHQLHQCFMTSSPVVVMAVRGNGAIGICRKMMGATFGSNAEPGTIRGDFGVSNSFNLIHGSDSPEAAEKELSLFFNDGEVQSYDLGNLHWIYDASEEL